jgi:hypothetical protein
LVWAQFLKKDLMPVDKTDGIAVAVFVGCEFCKYDCFRRPDLQYAPQTFGNIPHQQLGSGRDTHGSDGFAQGRVKEVFQLRPKRPRDEPPGIATDLLRGSQPYASVGKAIYDEFLPFNGKPVWNVH